MSEGTNESNGGDAPETIGVRVPDDLPEQLDNFLQFRIAGAV